MFDITGKTFEVTMDDKADREPNVVFWSNGPNLDQMTPVIHVINDTVCTSGFDTHNEIVITDKGIVFPGPLLKRIKGERELNFYEFVS